MQINSKNVKKPTHSYYTFGTLILTQIHTHKKHAVNGRKTRELKQDSPTHTHAVEHRERSLSSEAKVDKH